MTASGGSYSDVAGLPMATSRGVAEREDMKSRIATRGVVVAALAAGLLLGVATFNVLML